MRIWFSRSAFLLAVAIAVAGVPQQPGSSLRDVVDPVQAVPNPLPKPESPETPPESPEELAKTADLLWRVSQLMMVRLEGTLLPSFADRQLLEQLPPGGVILPRLMDPESMAIYVTDLRGRGRGGAKRFPFIIGVDLMGAAREAEPVRDSGLRIPAPLTIAASGAGERTAALYAAIASDLATVGLDFQWGPSLALASNLDSYRVNVHTFGSSPELSAAIAGHIGESLKSRNLDWVPQGFPGGVKTSGERAPAVLSTPRSQLRHQDLQPYEAAIAAGAGLVHVGTSLVPTLDDARPACLSPIVIREVLRDALSFDGLIVAGPMDSPDVSRIADSSDAAVEALMSGADMIYWNGSGPRVARAVVHIVQAVQSGALPESLINNAFTRVLKYKESRGINGWATPNLDEAKKLAKVAGKRTEPGDVERRAITLLRNRSEVLPLTEERSGLVGITGAYGVQELQEALEEYFKTVAAQAIRTARHTTRIQDFEINRLTRPGSPIRTVVAIFSDDIELAGQLQLIRGLRRNGQSVIVVLLGIPKNLAAYEEADALILAYGNVAKTADTMIALADILVGNAPADVLPPLRDLELKAGETATFNVTDVIRSPVGRLPLTFEPPFVAGFSVSYRPIATLERVHWDFGDGKRSTDAVATHQYSKPGTYNVTLRVGKKAPNVAEGTFRVTVK